MRKLWLLCPSFLVLASKSYAITSITRKIMNIDDLYIYSNHYTQNPYFGMESAIKNNPNSNKNIDNSSIWQQLFTQGSWNIFGEASYEAVNGINYYAYSASLFGQTGRVYGFSFGGGGSAANPVFSDEWKQSNNFLQNQFLPSYQVQEITQAFIEYQYKNIVQIDAGLISVPDNPWLAGTYYSNLLMPAATYRGILANIDPGGGWLLSAIGFNAAQIIGNAGFTNQTFYNPSYDYGTGTANILDDPTQYTIAIGAKYSAWNNNYIMRIWDYDFQNYANLLYFDNKIKLKSSNNLSFDLATQAGYETSNSNKNVFADNGYGTINSYMAGIKATLNYKIFQLDLGYNNVWGVQTSYGNGGLVSPYTYQLAMDPLYSTPYLLGLVDKGSAGSAIKIEPALHLLNHNLSISGAYTNFNTAAIPNSSEYDLITNYEINQVKGLSIFGVFGYISQPYYYSQYKNSTVGGSLYLGQIVLSFLY